MGEKHEGKNGGREEERAKEKAKERKRVDQGKKFSGWQGDRIGYLCAALLLWQLIGIEWF